MNDLISMLKVLRSGKERFWTMINISINPDQTTRCSKLNMARSSRLQCVECVQKLLEDEGDCSPP